MSWCGLVRGHATPGEGERDRNRGYHQKKHAGAVHMRMLACSRGGSQQRPGPRESRVSDRKTVALRALCVTWVSVGALHERKREKWQVISWDDGGEGAAAGELCTYCVDEWVGVDLRTRDGCPIDRHVDAATHNPL